MAAEEIDGTFGDGLDREDFEKLPCSWTYVVVCIFMPSLTGQLNVILTPAYTLHYEEMGWPLTRAGAAFSIGCGSRALVQQIVLRAGYWIAVPLCMVHLAIVILALIYTTSEWAVFAQIVAVWSIDPSCAIEGIAFDCFGASEVQAKQASSTALSVSTISVALSCTIGGLIYDATGWTGVTAYHCALEGLLVLLLSLQPACRKSFMEVFFPQKDPEVEAAEDQTETSGEMVFKQVVPGQAQAVQLPGATEELHLEEVEDEIQDENAKASLSRKSDQDDQSPGQNMPKWETLGICLAVVPWWLLVALGVLFLCLWSSPTCQGSILWVSSLLAVGWIALALPPLYRFYGEIYVRLRWRKPQILTTVHILCIRNI